MIKAPTLFATHFHELTALANENMDSDQPKNSAGIANYHVSAHIDSSNRKLTMLYKVSSFPAYRVTHTHSFFLEHVILFRCSNMKAYFTIH